MKKQIAFMIGGVLILAIIFLISWKFKVKDEPFDQRLAVVASFYPLADFATHVGGDLVNVTTITPTGAEPHEYEPTPQDLVKVYNAKIVITNGHGVDMWADRLKEDLVSKGIMVVRMSDDIKTEDPHFWLNPNLAVLEVKRIADAFIAIDPDQKDYYIRNRDEYIRQLVSLDESYRLGLERCVQRDIITAHNAFQYLGDKYGFTAHFIQGLSPDEDPSPQKMAELIRLAKNNHIQYIFFETLVNPKLAQTIANEVGAKTLVLNPIEGLTNEEKLAGKDYISIMQDNLVNLRLALVCQ